MSEIKTPRLKSLDLARGFVVFMMAPVHSMLFYGGPAVWNSLPGKLFSFIAEWHGAQVFMVIMGISFAISKRQSGKSVLKRAGLLLLVAYVLNVFKFLIPHLFGWLPYSLLVELQIRPGIEGYVQLFLLGDILHFAALALIVLFVISKFRNGEKIAFWLSLAIIFFGPFLWDATSNNPFINYGLSLIGGQPPVVYFPLLPWLVYPLLGYGIGKTIQKENKWLGFDSFWIVGAGITIVVLAVKYWLHQTELSSFYRTMSSDTFLHVGFVLIILSVWQWIANNVKSNFLFKMFTYCSKHITVIYIIQWILICWMLPFVKYRNSGFIQTAVLINLTSILTLGISFLINLEKSSRTKA